MPKNKKIGAPAIISEGTTGTNLMRGRDVRFELQGMGLPPKLIEIMAKLAEVNHTNMRSIVELATMQEQMLNIIQQFADVAGNMKERSDQMLRATQQLNDASEGDNNS